MEYEHLGLLHDMFKRQASATPERTAVEEAGGQSMTYKELDDVTNALALYLQKCGVTVDSLVGIYMGKCINYTISYIASLKAGGAYMPMDISYPLPLVKDILEDSKPVIVLTETDLQDNLNEARQVLVFEDGWLEKIKAQTADYKVPEDTPKPNLDSLAYTVYSSGTTGKPKGIQCPHRGSVFSYHHRHLKYPYKDDGKEREACNIFYTWEMLRPLLQGVTMYVIPDTVIYDPRLLCQFLEKHEITRMLFTPSLLEAVLDTENLDVTTLLKHMRVIIFCGEVVTVSLLTRSLKVLPHVQFVNLYSVSEAHDITCSDLSSWFTNEKASVEKRKFCHVGKLLPGVHIVIMDETLQPQPVGVPGEIYVGGPTLAKGYLNRPELNAQRFVASPPSLKAKVGERLYKSGDWGYMLSDGSFEICGRCDSMVKIRGYSVEKQAVERSLMELPMVNACVVEVAGSEGEDKTLVAYIVPDRKTTKKEVRAALKKHLPFYMIPSHFIFMSSLPILAASGKFDKRALPPVDSGDHELDEEGKPTTEMEKTLVPLWADVLHLKTVDVQESFFDLGGHSLLATRLLSKVQEKFGVELSVRDLFKYNSVSVMAKHIENRMSNGSDSPPAENIEEKINLMQEVENHDLSMLDFNIQLRAFWRSIYYGDNWRKAKVLLTGATGFLGTFLLRDLLLNTKMHIFCLVRDSAEQTGIERIQQALIQYGMLPSNGKALMEEQRRLDSSLNKRVTIITGDVALVNMGMTEEDHAFLTTAVDLVIHAAAYVNLIYPYQALHGTNVLGTQSVIKFACTTKIKPLHYISTDAVFPRGMDDCCETSDMTKHWHELEDGYSQSKWVAEQLVMRALNRGLPATIYRLGNLSGESKNAYWNPQDFNLLILQGCAYSGYAPDITWKVEMTPVDFASRIIMTVSQDMFTVVGKVLHLVNTKPLCSKWLFEWMTAHDYPLTILPFKDWAVKVKNTEWHHGSHLSRLLDTMIKDESFFSKESTFEQTNLEAVLHKLGTRYPETSSDLLAIYFKNLSVRQVIPQPRTRPAATNKALMGKVAIVTGASSGIGKAIAVHLGNSGAKVALAARRLDALEDLKLHIEMEGGVAISVKCDVTNNQQVKDLVKHTECTLGPVDILVNNAGVMYYGMLKNVNEKEWNNQIDVNCKGLLNCVGAVIKGMIERKCGHIVNMSSDAGRRGFAGLAVYSGSKFFVEGFSQGMRSELAKTGVKVTCIQPGDVKTELLLHSTDMEAKEAYDGSVSTEILVPDDIARAVIFAVTQPYHSSVNEILIEPREAPI